MREALSKAESMLASIRDGCGPEGEKAAVAAAREVSLTSQAEAQRAEVLGLQERFKKAGASVTELQTHIGALPDRSGVWPLLYIFAHVQRFSYALFVCVYACVQASDTCI
jgi:hypothetical protein